MNLICIDPGSHTGWATLIDGVVASGVEDISPLAARKAKPGRPAKLHKRTGTVLRPEVIAVPGRAAEPDHERWRKVWELLRVHHSRVPALDDVVLVHENAIVHHASQRAAQLAHEYQGILKMWALIYSVQRVEVPPLDLQRFVLGRKSTPKADEMLHAAEEWLGYQGGDHNVADALFLLEWARVHVMREQRAIHTVPLVDLISSAKRIA